MPREEMNLDPHQIMTAIIRTHPNPEKLLNAMLGKVAEQFIPQTEDQAVLFLLEWLDIAAGVCATVMASHLDANPDHEECPAALVKSTQELFEHLAKDAFGTMCEHHGLKNPFLEKSLNERTFEEIMKEMKGEC